MITPAADNHLLWPSICIHDSLLIFGRDDGIAIHQNEQPPAHPPFSALAMESISLGTPIATGVANNHRFHHP